MEKQAQYEPLRGDHDESRLSSSEIMEDGRLLGNETPSLRRNAVSSLWIKRAMVVLTLALYTGLVVLTTWTNAARIFKDKRRHGTRILHSPANEYIVYEPYVMEQWEDELAPKYFGEPSEDLDRSWHELFKHQNLGLSPEVMHDLGRENEGIVLPDGTYYGTMMVFHHLHCLKNIQHSLHPSYYALDNLTEHELEMHWDHTDHCLHMLMDAVMCQGDTSLITMFWQDHMFRPAGNFTSPHECVNWDRLMEWIVPNSRDLFGDGILVHPKHGPLLSGGKPTEAFMNSIQGGGFGKIGLTV